MTDTVFSQPVVLHLPGTGERKVATSFEAIECLEGEWPWWARGRLWRSALTACRDALDGWRSTAEARRSFVRAATRAGLVGGKRRHPIRHRLPAASPRTSSSAAANLH